MKSDLVDFTGRALAAGIERHEIADVLRRAGWAEYDIQAALSAFADVPFRIPVPRPQPYLSPREVFIYLVLFATLYATAFHLGDLFFSAINLAFPDPLTERARAYLENDIRWNMSVLLVAFPIFVFTLRAVTRTLLADPTKRASRPRKWLTYLTLFGASMVLVADVSTLIYNLLGGELTVRVSLKILTVAIIAGGIFGFFFNDLRKSDAT